LLANTITLFFVNFSAWRCHKLNRCVWSIMSI